MMAVSSPRSSPAPTVGSALGNKGGDGSELNTTTLTSGLNTSASLGAASNQQQGGLEYQTAAGVERRVTWLEEDVAVLRRRLLDECGQKHGGDGAASSCGSCLDGSGTGHGGVPSTGVPLRDIMVRFDEDLLAERKEREALLARINALEDSVAQEKQERDVQLRAFSKELEFTMKDLISRIDEGLCASALAMREKTDQTEGRLRTLIGRVDENLSLGAAALQDAFEAAFGAGAPHAEATVPAVAPANEVRMSAEQSHVQQYEGGQAPNTAADPDAAAAANDPSGLAADRVQVAQAADMGSSDELIRSWDQLRQENYRLRERRARLQSASVMSSISVSTGSGAHGSNTASPVAYPSTLQVSGNGLGTPYGGARPRAVVTPYRGQGSVPTSAGNGIQAYAGKAVVVVPSSAGSSLAAPVASGPVASGAAAQHQQQVQAQAPPRLCAAAPSPST